MATTPIPLPGVNTNDPTGNTSNPLAALQAVLARQPQAPGSGAVSSGIQIGQPAPLGNGLRPVPQAGPAQGEFSTKGGHQRASMGALVQSVQGVAAQAANQLEQHQNKILGQKFQTLVGSQKGIQAAQEMQQNAQKVLAQDPNNADAKAMMDNAQQMMQHNTTILNQLLDPTTPEGKKNIKLFEKGFGFDDKNADTPERAAAIEAMKKQQPGLNSGAAGLLSNMPQGIGMSPQTQVQADMVKAGVTPKAATGGQVLKAQTDVAKAETTDTQKKAELDLKYQRLGLDPKTGQPIPIDKLPLKVQAQVQSERANDELKVAQAKFAEAKQAALADPRSPQNQLALMRARSMSQFAQASMLRSQVGLLRYKMDSTSTGADGKTLPGAMMVDGQPIGREYASQVQATMLKQAQFTDVAGAVDNMAATAKALNDSGQKLNDPKIVKLTGNPHFKANDNVWFQNQMNSAVGATLTSQQRDYVIAQKQTVENITALRGMVKSGIAQKQIDNMINTLPGAQTPDFDYAARQITAIHGQLDRLQTGLPQLNIPSRTNQPGAPKSPASPANTDPLGIF